MVLGPRELSSDAYSSILAVFGIRHRSHGDGEMVARTAARSPPPTRAGGQDDGSYTNSLKKCHLLDLGLELIKMSLTGSGIGTWMQWAIHCWDPLALVLHIPLYRHSINQH